MCGFHFKSRPNVYSLWDSYQINHAAFLSNDLLRYKPAGDDGENYSLEELMAINPDTRGWLTIDDTHIDYPVVQGKDGMDYIGVVEIPALSLRLPVLSSWSEEKLKVAPCRYEGAVDTRDLIISGHSYKQHFRYIRNLVIGDSVIFTDMDGNRYAYEVSGTEVIPGNGVEQMSAGDWDLSLFTCTYNGSARHTVRCRLTEEQGQMETGQERILNAE